MTKIKRALQIFNNNINADKKVVLTLFEAELGISRCNAHMYYSKCKKMEPKMIFPVVAKFEAKDEPIVEEVKPTEKKREEYDYGDCVPEFLKKSYDKMGWL